MAVKVMERAGCQPVGVANKSVLGGGRTEEMMDEMMEDDMTSLCMCVMVGVSVDRMP